MTYQFEPLYAAVFVWGSARRITREEVEEIIKTAEKRGAVHQLSNIDGKDFSLFICNCKWDTCMV